MGQRLCMDIKEDGERIAVTYQHWSGYTASGLEIALDFCKRFLEVKQQDKANSALVKDVLDAMRMGQRKAEGSDRNDGLYEIGDKEEMEDLLSWSEMTITIDVATGEVELYDSFYAEYEEDEEDDDAKYFALNFTLDGLYNQNFITRMERFESLVRYVIEAYNNDVYKFTTKDGVNLWTVA